MKKAERIITLGNSNSGKSNYMGLSLSYICRYWKDLPMVGVDNSNFDDNVNQSEDRMQSRQWLGKTEVNKEYPFKAQLPNCWIPFVTSEHEFVVDDWPGEAFEDLGKPGQESACEQKTDNEQEPTPKQKFEKAIKESGSYVIFLDGEKLKNRGVESDIQKSLSALQRLLDDSSPSLLGRRFAFVVTKADILENLQEFTHESGDGLDVSKLQHHVTSKYATFFNFLDWHKLEYRIFAVSCVPLKEHRKVDPKNGTMPTEDWSLKDMECVLVHEESEGQRQDQLAPFRWLFRYPKATLFS